MIVKPLLNSATLFGFIIIMSALTGCEEKVRTVSYYVDNKDEIEKVLDKCRKENDKGYEVEGNLKENCENARRARSQITRDTILGK